MKATVHTNGQEFTINLNNPIDISTPLHPNQNTVRAFNAPPLSISPVQSGDFIGAVSEGAAVNFMNIRLNPHGNGTHTECVGHITDQNYTINQCLTRFWWWARLITLNPKPTSDGDQQIQREQLKSQLQDEIPEALIIRILPNPSDKAEKNYSNTNPPYFTESATSFLRQQGVQHLLTDLPSADKEDDGGKLRAHKAFWGYPDKIREQCTITELIHVPNNVEDGHYMLNLQIISLESDATPSKPILYPLD